ncbi:hypothetical protein BLA29_007653 [Euroglyphus maynei]|uniref:Uncharacterized protein n=1 Tax=Euroglyphus maynei TaxID=6958 RepID=A0A1Y3BRI5_EURMA|nr:hypothetical protein BLA29_007653 [Euroglyphus maynei]
MHELSFIFFSTLYFLTDISSSSRCHHHYHCGLENDDDGLHFVFTLKYFSSYSDDVVWITMMKMAKNKPANNKRNKTNSANKH